MGWLLVTPFRLYALLEIEDFVLLYHCLANTAFVISPDITKNELLIALVNRDTLAFVVIIGWVTILRTIRHVVTLLLTTLTHVVRSNRPREARFSATCGIECSMVVHLHGAIPSAPSTAKISTPMMHASAGVMRIAARAATPTTHHASSMVVPAMVMVVAIRVASALIRRRNLRARRRDQIVVQA